MAVGFDFNRGFSKPWFLKKLLKNVSDSSEALK